MKTYLKSIVTGALATAAVFTVGTGSILAQDRPAPGNFDPQQMRQRMAERMRDQFDVKDDAEWKAISERIDKVMEAGRGLVGPGGPGGPAFAAGRGGPGGAGFGGGPGRPGGFGGQGGPPPQARQGGPDRFAPPGVPPDAPDRPEGAPRGPRELRGPGGPGAMGMIAREPSPEMEALRKAIAEDAPAAEIKEKLAAVRAAREKKEAEVQKAQDELRKLLSARQEAVAVTLGLLK